MTARWRPGQGSRVAALLRGAPDPADGRLPDPGMRGRALARTSGAAAIGSLRGPAGTTALVVGVGVLVMVFFAQQYVGSVFVLAFTYAIVTAGMAVQIGFSQQIVFSQCVFMGLGAYGVALLNTYLGMSSLAAAPLVMIGCGAVALLLGSVVTRASGLALAVATIMLPLIATGYLTSASYLGGQVGLPLSSSLWQSSSPTATVVGSGLITVAILGVVVFVCSRILGSDVGLELYALGVDERTAAAMGVATGRRRLELFVLGSMFAALGGAVYAGTQLFVPATLVSAPAELSLLIMLFVGGRRSILGAVAGALAIQYISGASNWVSVNILLFEGVLITIVLLVDPEGLAGVVNTLRRRLQRHGPDPAAATASQPGAASTAATARPVSTDGVLPADSAATAPAAPFPEAQLAAGSRMPRPAGQQPDSASGDDRWLLECAGVSKDYGGLRVLDSVRLELPARGLFGLCGPNGAGKSTLLGVIGGTIAPSAGRVLLGGADITRLAPQQRFRLGVSRTFQAVHLIQGRTVLDNVAVSCLSSHQSSIARAIMRNRLADARVKAAAALDYLGIDRVSGREVSSLTLEDQRMVEFARAIAPGPRLLLLDEPAAGLSDAQRERLKGVLRTIAEMTCVLLVEHDLGLVAQISERIFVLAEGCLIFEGTSAEFRNSAAVNSLLIGR
jgi:ABC-type branched-subunit amino acid transport system ATPase component/ABC-type branched-subunit amino acid transport system permease subunit